MVLSPQVPAATVATSGRPPIPAREPIFPGNHFPPAWLSAVRFNQGDRYGEPESESGPAKPEPRPEARPATGWPPEPRTAEAGSEPPGPEARSAGSARPARSARPVKRIES